MQKPITVASSEFVSSMATLINESGLPAFIIGLLMKEMIRDINVLSKRQLESDEALYKANSSNETN